jgi:uncharacterized small protein (DUF1192 family)
MKASTASRRSSWVSWPDHSGQMFGCECALPFLDTLPSMVASRRAVSGLALGAAFALGACDASSDAPPADTSQQAPVDKVSAAFAKVEREIERTKARLERRTKGPSAELHTTTSADAASAPN